MPGNNRLAGEQSPYLLQHAENPVDWHPWGDEAFALARAQDKPVFLSIGYSTCHWCHVMAHESFEDPEIAALLNDAFVCIKVDREERPDVDDVYMTVCNMLTGRGGWPLTVFLDPDKRPIHAATYLPPRARGNMPGLAQIVPRFKELWRTNRDGLAEAARRILQSVESMDPTGIAPGGTVSYEPANHAARDLAERFDGQYGGFGTSPKFPSPHTLLFLLRVQARTNDPHQLTMVTRTLEAMAAGGIQDHLGYGFHRYSTDREWLLPHFEKMLYDQALLALTFLECGQAAQRPDFLNTARHIFQYVTRDLTDAEGGFHTAEDADSEGEEGLFYTWTMDELHEVLGPKAESFARAYSAREDGNFHDEATGEPTGRNILHPAPDTDPNDPILKTARHKLLKARDKRVRPHKDDKVLTDLNGLMIAALARGSRVLGEPEWLDHARRAASFLETNLMHEGYGLLHGYRHSPLAARGNLDDYAFLAWGYLELFEAGFDPAHLQTALGLARVMLDKFGDETRRGLWFTERNDHDLPIRRRDAYDGAIPSGNSTAAFVLTRLARITGEESWLDQAKSIVEGFGDQILANPSGFSFMLTAVEAMLDGGMQTTLAGEPDDPATLEMLSEINGGFRPGLTLLVVSEATRAQLTPLAKAVRTALPVNGGPTAYICANFRCSPPVSDMPGLRRHLTP